MIDLETGAVASGISTLDRKIDDVAVCVRAQNTDMDYLRNLRARVQ